jgi:thiamine pyrophosphate-dependent acetolactate synthase large subunit-like protein
MNLKDADVVFVLDVDIPWMMSANDPADDAFVAIVDVEPSKQRIPIMEFTADLRLTADALLTINALDAEIRALASASDRERFAARAARWGEASRKRRQALADAAQAAAGKTPIDVRWLSYEIGQALGKDWIVFDDTIVVSQVQTTCSARTQVHISTTLAAAAVGHRGQRLAQNSQHPTATSSRSPVTASICSARPSIPCGRHRSTGRLT